MLNSLIVYACLKVKITTLTKWTHGVTGACIQTAELHMCNWQFFELVCCLHQLLGWITANGSENQGTSVVCQILHYY